MSVREWWGIQDESGALLVRHNGTLVWGCCENALQFDSELEASEFIELEFDDDPNVFPIRMPRR